MVNILKLLNEDCVSNTWTTIEIHEGDYPGIKLDNDGVLGSRSYDKGNCTLDVHLDYSVPSLNGVRAIYKGEVIKLDTDKMSPDFKKKIDSILQDEILKLFTEWNNK